MTDKTVPGFVPAEWYRKKRAAIQRVRDLHKPNLDKDCLECLFKYPCPTIRALDEETE